MRAGTLARGAVVPWCRVSPMRWSYLFLGSVLFAAAFAWRFCENLPVDGMDEPLVRGFFALFALGCGVFPFLLARSTNDSQYLATDRRVIVCSPTLSGLDWESYDLPSGHPPLHSTSTRSR